MASKGHRTVIPRPSPTTANRHSVTMTIRLVLSNEAGAGVSPNASLVRFLRFFEPAILSC
jgi:hypothetical protein